MEKMDLHSREWYRLKVLNGFCGSQSWVMSWKSEVNTASWDTDLPEGPIATRNVFIPLLKVLRREMGEEVGVATDTNMTQTLPRFCLVWNASKESDQKIRW
jgi:hypothetical protein